MNEKTKITVKRRRYMPENTVLTYHPAYERDKMIDEFLCISLPESDGHHMVSNSTFYKKE